MVPILTHLSYEKLFKIVSFFHGFFLYAWRLLFWILELFKEEGNLLQVWVGSKKAFGWTPIICLDKSWSEASDCPGVLEFVTHRLAYESQVIFLFTFLIPVNPVYVETNNSNSQFSLVSALPNHTTFGILCGNGKGIPITTVFSKHDEFSDCCQNLPLKDMKPLIGVGGLFLLNWLYFYVDVKLMMAI